MSAALPADPNTLDSEVPGHSHAKQGLAKLAVGAIGVVYGDIGTSPLYAMKEVFVGHHPLTVDQLHIFGVVSLMFWSLLLIVTLKYVMLILRADNNGEGGSLALLALIQRRSGAGKRWGPSLVILGVLATALFFGDCMITPAISVLSAVEGLATVEQGFDSWVLPISIGILVALFYLQSVGTARVGKLFGPIMLVYFITLAVLGLMKIMDRPDILMALNPIWAVRFAMTDGTLAFLALGSVVLCVTGAEALYADMGHFGRRPIQFAWACPVLPALMLNYLGQGALLLDSPEAAQNPFFLMASEDFRLPLVILATMATVIASQAVITGAYSVVQQAVQLGLMPRIKIEHTSASEAGQIYIPVINWALLTMVLLLILGFQESSNLAAAYGIAVTGTMFITTCMMGVLFRRVWHWPIWLVAGFVGVFVIIDGLYFASNLTKVPDGGWFPLLVGMVVFVLLTTWARGRQLMIDRLREAAMPIKIFIQSAANSAARVPGTAVFMTSAADGVPHALLHNLKHNKVIHERVILLTVKIADVPFVQDENRVTQDDLGQGFHRMVLKFGFMQEPDVPGALKLVKNCGAEFRMMDTSFFLARQTLLPSDKPAMALWREQLFAWMLRNAESAMEFFRLPTNRVVELGSQVESSDFLVPQPVNILHLHSSFSLGGKEARAVRLMNAFGDRARHTIVSGMPDQLGAERAIAKGIKYEIAQNPPPLTGKPSVARYEAIARYMARFDLVLTYNWGAIDGVMARRVFPKGAPPLIHHEDGFNADEAVRLNRMRNLYRRFALPAAHALVVPSAALEGIALETWKQPRDRVHRISNGIPTMAYAGKLDPKAIPGFVKRKGELVIGTVAGLRAVKDLPLLVRAVGGLAGKVKLVIVGEGPEEQAIRDAAEAMFMDDALVMPGFLRDPYRYIGLFDVFALSSKSEQQPIVVMEAMAAGLPIVAPPVGDVPLMVAEENRPYLTQDRYEVTLRDRMKWLQDSPQNRAAIGWANQQRARAMFDESAMIAAYAKLYSDAIGRPGTLG